MSRKLDGDINEWAKDMVNSSHLSGFSGINVVEKILRDPGISTDGSRHRIHWWPRGRTPAQIERSAKMSRAMHQIDSISQICLIVDSGHILTDDGQIFNKHMLAKRSSLGVRKFNEYRKKAKAKLSKILYG